MLTVAASFLAPVDWAGGNCGSIWLSVSASPRRVIP